MRATPLQSTGQPLPMHHAPLSQAHLRSAALSAAVPPCSEPPPGDKQRSTASLASAASTKGWGQGTCCMAPLRARISCSARGTAMLALFLQACTGACAGRDQELNGQRRVQRRRRRSVNRRGGGLGGRRRGQRSTDAAACELVRAPPWPADLPPLGLQPPAPGWPSPRCRTGR